MESNDNKNDKNNDNIIITTNPLNISTINNNNNIDIDDINNNNDDDDGSYKDKIQLYIMHFCFAFISRMWDFAIILLIAQLSNNSLRMVAISGLLSSGLIFFTMPKIGSWLDKSNRLKSAKVAIFYKITSVSLAYLLCAFLNKEIEIDGNIIIFHILTIIIIIIIIRYGNRSSNIKRIILFHTIIMCCSGNDR